MEQSYLKSWLMLLAIAGCAYPTSHENFVKNIQAQVGENYDELMRSPGWGWNKAIEVKTLANGDIAYRHHHRQSCYFTREVNPETRIIVKTSWEGSEKDCGIAP